MYCVQWLIPVLLIPKPVNPALLQTHVMFMVLYLIGFFLERKPCTVCSLVFLATVFLICYSGIGNCLFWSNNCDTFSPSMLKLFKYEICHSTNIYLACDKNQSKNNYQADKICYGSVGAFPRPKPPRNSSSPAPAPTSAFLSPGPAGPRLYPARSSAGLEVSLLGPVGGLSLALSEVGFLFRVAGTISGGRWSLDDLKVGNRLQFWVFWCVVVFFGDHHTLFEEVLEDGHTILFRHQHPGKIDIKNYYFDRTPMNIIDRCNCKANCNI
ncbi:hypothetical protein TSAR_005082 [Trichomalopsis sarcophagae]|uniref:Bladder cancer-associated protein n=1 Tax=Trichomalopsis sarcophagae TaxID=543379 RepID=A0A232EVM9_9HYME|nr:hypothetical protein TSAR_005082 [Trichomalopsis sarcophagae]